MSGVIGTQGFTKGQSGIAGRPAPGTVVQVVKAHNNSGHESSGTTSDTSSSSLTLAITTKFKHTAIKVEMSHYGTHAQEVSYGKAWIQRAISGGGTTQLYHNAPNMVHHHINRADNRNNYEPLHFGCIDEPGQVAGTTITYTARYHRLSGQASPSGLYYFCHSGYLSHVALTEYIV